MEKGNFRAKEKNASHMERGVMARPAMGEIEALRGRKTGPNGGRLKEVLANLGRKQHYNRN